MLLENRWGPVCGKSLSSRPAAVVCRELGYAESMSTFIGRPQDSEQLVLDRFRCNGDESKVAECRLGTWKNKSCPQWNIVCRPGRLKSLK